MVYLNNIPNAGDIISNSQPQIKANFAAIDTNTTGTGYGFSRNHVTMNDTTNGGLHHRVDYYAAVASPALSGVSSLYPKTVTAIGELFYKNATKDSQITSSSLVNTNGEGFLPGGLQIRCGSAASAGAGVVVPFSTDFPTTCIAVVATGSDPTAFNVVVKTKLTGVAATDKHQFTLTSQKITGGVGGTAEMCYYIAIGY